MHRRLVAGTVILLLAMVSAAPAASPAVKCQSGKNRAAGKYATCRHYAEAKLAANADVVGYEAAIDKCVARYVSTWQKLEAQASGDCPSDGDELAIETAIDQCTSNVANSLAGGVLVDCSAELASCASTNLASCESAVATCQASLVDPISRPLKTGQTTCYDGNGIMIACAGTGQDGDLQMGSTRSYTDNGDGTITDARTGLTWEKLAADGGIHDLGTGYDTTSAVSVKIATLNATMFAGHTDWRLPNRHELESLLSYDHAVPAIDPVFHTACTTGCSVAACSCTASGPHWTSTTYAIDFLHSWTWNVNFLDGETVPTPKWVAYGVRAVRGG